MRKTKPTDTEFWIAARVHCADNNIKLYDFMRSWFGTSAIGPSSYRGMDTMKLIKACGAVGISPQGPLAAKARDTGLTFKLYDHELDEIEAGAAAPGKTPTPECAMLLECMIDHLCYFASKRTK